MLNFLKHPIMFKLTSHGSEVLSEWISGGNTRIAPIPIGENVLLVSENIKGYKITKRIGKIGKACECENPFLFVNQ